MAVALHIARGRRIGAIRAWEPLELAAISASILRILLRTLQLANHAVKQWQVRDVFFYSFL